MFFLFHGRKNHKNGQVDWLPFKRRNNKASQKNQDVSRKKSWMFSQVNERNSKTKKEWLGSQISREFNKNGEYSMKIEIIWLVFKSMSYKSPQKGVLPETTNWFVKNNNPKDTGYLVLFIFGISQIFWFVNFWWFDELKEL